MIATAILVGIAATICWLAVLNAFVINCEEAFEHEKVGFRRLLFVIILLGYACVMCLTGLFIDWAFL